MTATSEHFFHLSPDGVLKAAEDAGLEPSRHIITLNSLENRVYDLRLEDGSHVVIKFYRPGRWTLEQIKEEHDFLYELKESEIPVIAPLHLRSGETVQERDGIFFTIWPRVGGRIPDELGLEELQIIGRTLARIHNVGATKQTATRISLTSERYVVYALHHISNRGMIPDNVKTRFEDVAMKIAETYDAMIQNIPFLRIHGDLHLGNLLRRDDGWNVVDFDDFLMGPAVQDIWMIAPGSDSHCLQQREVFLSAYREFREFEDEWLRLTGPLRALRYIHYAGWIARRWDDPAFASAFPHFGTTDYWTQELLDLEDQILLIQKGGDIGWSPEREEKVAEGKELTNSDFFWDWEGD